MKALYFIVSRLATFLIPLLLLTVSFAINLTNAKLHKNSLKSSDFYTKLSGELRNDQIKAEDLDQGFGTVLVSSVLKDLATPGWIQNLFEKNIDNFSGWMNGEKSDWVLYVPSKEIEIAVFENINQRTKAAGEQFPTEIKNCTAEESETLKREGLDLSRKDFCLPENVKNGQQSLTEFFALTAEDTQNQEFLDKLIRNNNLNPFSDSLNINNLSTTNPLKTVFYESLKNLRNFYLNLRDARYFILLSSLGLFLASILTAKMADRNLYRESKRLLWQIATATITALAGIILLGGGFVYLSSIVQNFLLPGITTDEIVSLLSLEMVKFIFNIFSLAFWISLGLLGVYGIVLILEKNNLLGSTKNKNEYLKNRSSLDNLSKNKTFDGSFQNELLNLQIKNSQDRSQPEYLENDNGQPVFEIEEGKMPEINPVDFSSYQKKSAPSTYAENELDSDFQSQFSVNDSETLNPATPVEGTVGVAINQNFDNPPQTQTNPNISAIPDPNTISPSNPSPNPNQPKKVPGL